MTTPLVIAIVVVGMVLLACSYAYSRKQHRLATTYVDQCQCGKPLTLKTAHTVKDEMMDSENGISGIHGISAAFCNRHCPGGCDKPKEHK